MFDSHPQPLNLQVFLFSHGAELVLVLTGQLLRLDLQGGAAGLARQLRDRRRREKIINPAAEMTKVSELCSGQKTQIHLQTDLLCFWWMF